MNCSSTSLYKHRATTCTTRATNGAGQQRRPFSRAAVVTHLSRREALLAGLAAATTSGTALGAQAADAVRPKPFCSVVDNIPLWAYATPWQEDLVDFAGGKTWYRWVNVPPAASGDLVASLTSRYSPVAADKLPLIVVGGGPGLPATYLESVEIMGGVGRQVVFYDQVGVGNTFLASNSSCPPVEQLTLQLFAQQIDALRRALKFERCHLYGQGVGGMLALSYAASQQGLQGGIVSVTAASTPSSYAQLVADRREALKQLGSSAEELLLAADAGRASSSDKAAIIAARQRYNLQFVCRSQAATGASPLGCVRSAQQRRSQPVFAALAGRRFFSAAGALADWDVASLQPASTLQGVPVLVTRGQYDEVAAGSAQQLADALPAGRLASFGDSGSFQHIDAWEQHLGKVEEHLCIAEGSTPPEL